MLSSAILHSRIGCNGQSSADLFCLQLTAARDLRLLVPCPLCNILTSQLVPSSPSLTWSHVLYYLFFHEISVFLSCVSKRWELCFLYIFLTYEILFQLYLKPKDLISLPRDTQQLSDSGRFHFRSYSSLIRWMLNKETRHTASTSNRWYFAFELCCHSNETLASIANPPNSAQLERTPYNSPSYIRVRAVVWECGEPQTHRHRRLGPLYISPRLLLTQIVTKWIQLLR